MVNLCLWPEQPQTRYSLCDCWYSGLYPWTWCTTSALFLLCLHQCQICHLGQTSWWSIQWHYWALLHLHQLPTNNQTQSTDKCSIRRTNRTYNTTNIPNLYFHWCTNHHCLLQRVFIECWWMVIEVHNGDKDFCKAVFSISVFGFHIKVKLGFDLSIQTGPGLSVDDSRIRLNEKPAEKYKTESTSDSFTI